MEEKENSFKLVESRDAIDLVPRWEPQAWWYFAAAGVIFSMMLLVLVLRRKKVVADPGRDKREAYLAAKAGFAKGTAADPKEAAVTVSEILRRYLAGSMREPALFETHEEFISRHDALKDLPGDIRDSVAAFFAQLAELKYSPATPDADPAAIHAGGLQLLERIHAA